MTEVQHTLVPLPCMQYSLPLHNPLLRRGLPIFNPTRSKTSSPNGQGVEPTLHHWLLQLLLLCIAIIKMRYSACSPVGKSQQDSRHILLTHSPAEPDGFL